MIRFLFVFVAISVVFGMETKDIPKEVKFNIDDYLIKIDTQRHMMRCDDTGI